MFHVEHRPTTESRGIGGRTMTSAPHLLNEDRPDFDRVLDEALHIVLGDLSAHDEAGTPLNAEQLRPMALAPPDVMGGAAAEEYEASRTAREQARDSAR